MRTPALALAVLLAGCGPDLPAGWERARSLELEQSECRGPSYHQQSEVQASARAGGIEVRYLRASFRCEQQVEAFLRVGEGGYEVLFQPEDLDPKSVFRCNCAYDLQASFEAPAGTHAVTVWHRGDRYGDGEAKLFQVVSTSVTVP